MHDLIFKTVYVFFYFCDILYRSENVDGKLYKGAKTIKATKCTECLAYDNFEFCIYNKLYCLSDFK